MAHDQSDAIGLVPSCRMSWARIFAYLASKRVSVIADEDTDNNGMSFTRAEGLDIGLGIIALE